MKVFVTGGTGLIGRHLTAVLSEQNDTVVCVSRLETRARSLLPMGVEIVEADPLPEASWIRHVHSNHDHDHVHSKHDDAHKKDK